MSFDLNRSWDFPSKSSKEIDYYNYFKSLKDTEKTYDIVQMAADFYLSFAICNKAIIHFPSLKIKHPNEIDEATKILRLSKKEVAERNFRYFDYIENSSEYKLQKITDSIIPSYYELIEVLDCLFVDYILAAIGGEVRHHQGVSCLGKGGADQGRYIAWSRWADIHENYGDIIIQDAIDLFLDFPPGSYGGEPWANAASLLLNRRELSLASTDLENKTIFIDRVFNMQHNTGSLLNKLPWANKRVSDLDSVHNMHETVLKAHSSNPPNLKLLCDKASQNVKSAVDKIFEIAKMNNLNINSIY